MPPPPSTLQRTVSISSQHKARHVVPWPAFPPPTPQVPLLRAHTKSVPGNLSLYAVNTDTHAIENKTTSAGMTVSPSTCGVEQLHPPAREEQRLLRPLPSPV